MKHLGVFSLLIFAVILACTKDKTQPISNDVALSLEGEASYFTGIIAGDTVSISNSMSHYTNVWLGSTANDDRAILPAIQFIDPYSLLPIISVFRGSIHLPSADSSNWINYFYDDFPLGNYNFGVTSLDGVSISFFFNGEEWSTRFGSADQTGSTFEVYETITGTYHFRKGILVKANLNCNLYNSAGQMKVMENGSFSGVYVFH